MGGCRKQGRGMEGVDGLANDHKHLALTVTAAPVNTICLISVKTLPYFPFKV